MDTPRHTPLSQQYKNRLERDRYYVLEQLVTLRTEDGVDTLVPFGHTRISVPVLSSVVSAQLA